MFYTRWCLKSRYARSNSLISYQIERKKLLKTIIYIYFTYHTIINCTCTYLVYYRSILFHCILQSLVYMGIRKCVCDILSTVGLHPRAKIILLRLQFTYLFLTHFTWVGNKKYQCTPFFKSLHSNKHFFACQNMYTRLLIQIWPIIKCSFAVCFSEGNSKEISQKCFKFFFWQTTRFVRNPGALEIPQSGCNAKRIENMKMWEFNVVLLTLEIVPPFKSQLKVFFDRIVFSLRLFESYSNTYIRFRLLWIFLPIIHIGTLFNMFGAKKCSHK